MINSLNAQQVNIPDSNFKQSLIDLVYDDILDSSIQYEIINLVKYLNI